MDAFFWSVGVCSILTVSVSLRFLGRPICGSSTVDGSTLIFLGYLFVIVGVGGAGFDVSAGENDEIGDEGNGCGESATGEDGDSVWFW